MSQGFLLALVTLAFYAALIVAAIYFLVPLIPSL